MADHFPFLDVDCFPFLDADIVADCSVMPRDFLFFDWDVVGSSLRDSITFFKVSIPPKLVLNDSKCFFSYLPEEK